MYLDTVYDDSLVSILDEHEADVLAETLASSPAVSC